MYKWMETSYIRQLFYHLSNYIGQYLQLMIFFRKIAIRLP